MGCGFPSSQILYITFANWKCANKVLLKCIRFILLNIGTKFLPFYMYPKEGIIKQHVANTCWEKTICK